MPASDSERAGLRASASLSSPNSIEGGPWKGEKTQTRLIRIKSPGYPVLSSVSLQVHCPFLSYGHKTTPVWGTLG